MNEEEQQKLLTEIKRLEGIYLQPQEFKQYKNYWLPDYIVKESTNVLSLGVHRDVGWEQSMLKDNPNMNIHLYDPTPDTVKMWETNFPGKDKMTFHQVAYAKDNGKMKFYYDKNDLSKCYSLLPLPQFGENPAHIEVDCKNLKTIMQDDMPQVDIIKADIEGVWWDFCREIIDNDIDFKGLLIEFEVKLINNEESLNQYEQLLKDLNYKYECFLNRPRNKCLSEAIILKGR